VRTLVLVCIVIFAFVSAVRADAPNEAPERPLVHAGLGEGLNVESEDGRFALKIRGRAQIRAAAVFGDTDESVTFLLRRFRLVFSGHLFHSDVRYYFQLGMAPLDMEPDLLIPVRDAYLTYAGLRDLQVRAGQMKVPFSRERVVSSSALSFADRTIVNAELNLDRDMGVQVFANDLFGLGGHVGYALGVFGGNGRNRPNADTGLLYVARLEAFPFGPMEDAYSQSDFVRSSSPRLAIGAAAAFNQGSRRARSTHGATLSGAFDYVHFAVDMMLKVAGFSLEAEFLSRRATRATTEGDEDGMPVTLHALNAMGWFAQASYLFTPEFEVSARYAEVIARDDATYPLPFPRDLAAAFSWYPAKHDLKLQLDYSRRFDGSFAEGLHEVRLQTQLFF
jgi:phosphate-selective porin OprO/OprP